MQRATAAIERAEPQRVERGWMGGSLEFSSFGWNKIEFFLLEKLNKQRKKTPSDIIFPLKIYVVFQTNPLAKG